MTQTNTAQLSSENSPPPESDLQQPGVSLRRAIAKLFFWCVLLICADRLVFQVLMRGYNGYFGLNRASEIVFVGNSRTALGVDHKLIEKETGVTCAKFALNGATAKNRYAMVKHLIETHPSCQTIVFDVSAYSFNDRNLSAAAYTLLYPYIGSAAIDEHIKSAAKTSHEFLIRKAFLCPRFTSTTIGLAARGLLGRDDNLKFASVDLSRVQHLIDSGRSQSLETSEDGKRVFLDTVAAVTQSNRRLVLVHLPVVKMLNDVDRSAHDANIQILRDLARSNANVKFIDLNSDFEQRLDLMYDGIHLNADGKQVLSKLLATKLVDSDK